MWDSSPFPSSIRDAALTAERISNPLVPRSVLRALFPSRLAPLWLVLICGALPGQTYRVESSHTITVDVPGATAAYALDATYADAAAQNGVVRITGKIHGTTHVVVVTPAGTQPFEVVVVDPPVKYPPGFLNAIEYGSEKENGFSESRYTSVPGQVQSQLDFSRRQEDTTIHTHVVATRMFGDLLADEARSQISSAYYEISTPDRDITILDKYLEESPLGIRGSILRGVHYSQDGWFLHAGYTSVAAFDGLFLPAKAEDAIEGGYQYTLTEHSSLTGTYYYFRVPSSDLVGQSGSVGLLTYDYSLGENFHFSTDLGVSDGVGASARLIYNSDRDTIKSSFRYAPSTFASVGSNNLRGLRSDISWTRRLTSKLSNDLTFYSNRLTLPGLQQSTYMAGSQLRYQLVKHWTLFGGITGSTSQTAMPVQPPVRNFTALAGLGFNSRHFGVQGQYQYTRVSKQDSGGNQFQGSANAGAGPFSISAFAQRQTQSPSLAFILGQSPGLQQALDMLGIQATTIQQVDELLAENSYLFAAGYIKGATINLIPVRSQAGGTINWLARGPSQPQFSYNFLYNDNHGLMGSALSVTHSLLYTQRLGSEYFTFSCSLMGTKTPGVKSIYKDMLSVAWRHQFSSVPGFIIPEHHGVVSGLVFRDDNSKGTYEAGMPLVAGAEVELDDLRRMKTGADGLYRFPRVPVGKHKLTVFYKSAKPTFFSTQSEVEVAENDTVNFGVGSSLSGLIGKVTNDAGQGVMGVIANIRNKDKHWNETTDGEGSFSLRQLPEGEYDVEIDEASVPAGYLTSELAAMTVKVGASTPGNAAFSVRALRSIGGRVLTFDQAAGKEVPLEGRTVTLKETGKTSTSDIAGQYLFRGLPAGSYTIAVKTESGEVTKSVKLPSSPLTLTNIDLQIAGSARAPVAPVYVPPPVPLPAPTPPTKPTPLPEPEPVAKPKAPAEAASQHASVGRQKLGEGRYQEAIAELSEAIRLAPGDASAYNARGFAWYKLHAFNRALQDLDKAIQLDETYVAAYHTRGLVRKAAGDLSKSEEDFRRAAMVSRVSGTEAADESIPKAKLAPIPPPPPQAPGTSAAIPGDAAAPERIETARKLIQTSQYREAIEELNRAIRTAPQAAKAYNVRGFAWLKLHDYDRAISDLDTAIRLNPKYANAYHIRGVVRNLQGDHAGAETDLRREKELMQGEMQTSVR